MTRKSKTVSLTILAVIATAACDESSVKHCVDEQGAVQDENNCTTTTDDAGVVHTPHPGFRWYYGGYSTPQSPGTKVTGGSYDPSPGITYSPPSISRGGFGGTGEAHGGAGAGE